MTMIEYVARFTELARFIDDYVATDLARVMRFENGLKLSMMLGALGMRVLVARGRRVSFLPVRERSRGLLIHVGSKAVAIRARDRLGCQSGWVDGVLHCQQPRHMRRDCPQI